MLRRFESFVAVALAGSLAGGGCTHWGAVNVYGQKQEVGRQLTGAPQVAETSSSNMSANFFATKGQSTVTGADAAAGNAFASTDSQKRMHCVQQAQIQYVQPYQIRPEVQGRVWDVVGGVVLGLAGLSVITSAAIISQPGVIPPGDPAYMPPPNVTPQYIAGGVMLAGAAAWLIYSYAALPSGPPPAVQSTEQRWTATEYVEAVGCGLVPGDPVLAAPAPPPPAPAPYTQAPAPPPPAPAPYTQASAPPPPAPAAAPTQSAGGKKQEGDVAARLQKLEKLHKAGLLTDEEYKRKRKEMVDGL